MTSHQSQLTKLSTNNSKSTKVKTLFNSIGMGVGIPKVGDYIDSVYEVMKYFKYVLFPYFTYLNNV